ncbi:DUF2306 domain-containing protein [Paenibacillus oenotherae]|uniref:DUF2306 domain-containing protein n=1 Tax=Paenibacillus oenotherae TaxID=1435645 RepID=A0ABS7D7B6_9BACL|nr:DUF2306 domain-containing protein [Paenibacillus oenotherae]MBW7475834.1 DUF2306 domain-containing protein [Paenibacillus oenotherae]
MDLFQVLLVIHIAAGFVCLAAGIGAALVRKRKGLHTGFGEIYHAVYVVIFVTSIWMAILHWESSAYLFFIGIFSYGLALFGYVAGKRRRTNWIGRHIGGMLGSYIAIMTAILVVNGHRIPLLNDLPALLLWFIPTIIGTPIIVWIGRKHGSRN